MGEVKKLIEAFQRGVQQLVGSGLWMRGSPIYCELCKRAITDENGLGFFAPSDIGPICVECSNKSQGN